MEAILALPDLQERTRSSAEELCAGDAPWHDGAQPRLEAKYLVPPALLPALRGAIRRYCRPDPFTRGDPPVYTNLTLMLDTPSLALHHAREYDAPNRVKLRARLHAADEGRSEVSLELKRKVGAWVVKSSAVAPAAEFGERLCRGEVSPTGLRRASARRSYAEFVRLVRELDARPVVLLRYVREAYGDEWDSRVRVTLDRQMAYQPARGWNSWGAGRRWRTMDSALACGRRYSGAILELKTSPRVPRWMLELVHRFGLVRTAFCKYSTALRLETLYRPAAWQQFSPLGS